MSFALKAQLKGLTEALAAADQQARAGSMRAMRQADEGLRQVLKGQTGAILGERMARTWKGKVYPERGESLTPAAYIWSKAPGIVDAYARGVTIVAKAGRRLLAVPTEAVPRRASGRALKPQEVEQRYGKRLRFVPAGGGHKPKAARGAVAYLVLDGASLAKSSGRARNAGPRVKSPASIVMFELVVSVKVPKKLDLQSTLDRAAAELPALLAKEWGQ